MQVNTTGQAVPQGGGSPDSIAALEKQREQLMLKLGKVAEDKSLDARQKQEMIGLYELQLVVINARIAQLQDQHAQAAAARAAGALPARAAATAGLGNDLDGVSNVVHLVA